MVRRLALVLMVACGPGVQSPSAVGEETSIVDVTLVPMDRATAIPHQTVIVRGGKIFEVGAAGKLSPRGKQIDGRGKWLIPGLSDMHVHTFDPVQLSLFVAMGVTNIRIMWGSPGAIGVRDAIARGDDRIAPSIFTAGPIVDGNPPIWPGSRGLKTPQEGTDEVLAQKAAGYDFIKVYSKLPADIYAAIVAEAAKHGMPVMGHVPVAAGLEAALDAKQRTIEHLDQYAAASQPTAPAKDLDFKARIAFFKTADATKLADLVGRTKTAGTWNCPTLVVQDRIANLDQPTDRPEFKYISKAMVESWDPKNDFRFKSWGAGDFQMVRESNAWRFALVKQLADAGAGILAGTDVGNPGLVPGFSLHQELELLVAAKLTPAQALRASTSGPAELLGAQYDWGTIKKGVRADLVLLDGDPLADIKNTQKIAGVMLRGRWFDRAALDKILADAAAIYAGTRSRFEGVPYPPTPNGKPAAFTARYAGGGQNVAGEQRIVAAALADSVWILGEERNENETPDRWEIDAGPDGKGRKIHITGDGVDITAERKGTNLHLVGTVGAAKRTLDETIEADELLGGSPIAADSLFYRQLGQLKEGDTTQVKLAVIDTRNFAIEHQTLGVKRLPDATRTVGVKQVPARIFQVQLGLLMKFEVALDADGWPVETADFRRVE